MKDEPLTECPRCKTASLKRLIGAGAGLLFKGSGFYLTDYRKSSAAPSSGNKETKSPPPKPESPASKKETDSA
jgi:predicted nucleic acid-binding Zn ribbon protein